jgi:hypothetical protein
VRLIGEYSAAATKFSFWFHEYRKVLSLIRDGLGKEAIRRLSRDEDIFVATSKDRGNTVASVVYARVTSMPEELNRFIDASDLETQKLIVLISVMNTERLFFEFMYEVFREKMIVGDMILTDLDFRTFFHYKQETNDTVRNWSDASLNSLRKTYKTYLVDAGITNRTVGDRKIIKPYLDTSLRNVLISVGMETVLESLGLTDS